MTARPSSSLAHIDPTDVTVRALADSDRAPARALFDGEVARGNPYAARARDLLDGVTPQGEYRADVAERHGAILGVGIYGLVAAASGAGALYAIVIDPAQRRTGAGRALVATAEAALRKLGARFAMLELPDDPAELAGVTELLGQAGFVETARVPDLYRDGVALTFLIHRLG